MAGQLSNAGEELALNMLFRNTGTKPTNVYLGLTTVAVAEANGLADITEEGDATYARQEITFAAPAQEGGKGTVKNSAAINFGPWTANALAPITHAFITDVSTGTAGVILAYFTLPDAKSPVLGETLTVPIDNLVFDLD